MRAVSIADVQIGDRIYWGQGGRCTVSAIEYNAPTGSRYKDQVTGEWIKTTVTRITGKTMTFDFHKTCSDVRKGWTEAMVADVNAYQETLTKAGTVRKTRKSI